MSRSASYGGRDVSSVTYTWLPMAEQEVFEANWGR
jgi:hypothetical protein